MITNFAFMFMPISGLTMIGITGVSRFLMGATGAEGDDLILKVEEEYISALVNYDRNLKHDLTNCNKRLIEDKKLLLAS